MKITRINHAALNVPAGVEDMERFYTGLLGIPTVPRDIPPEFAARMPMTLKCVLLSTRYRQKPAMVMTKR